MYTCQECGKLSQPGEPQNTKVLKKRERKYTSFKGETTYGWEIEKEIKVCNKCAGLKEFVRVSSRPIILDLEIEPPMPEEEPWKAKKNKKGKKPYSKRKPKKTGKE